MKSVRDILPGMPIPATRVSPPTPPSPPYQAPASPVYRWSVVELHAAIAHCPHCAGLGRYRRDVDIHHADFGKLFPCPACAAYTQELHSRRVLALMQPLIERYSLLRDDLLTRTFANFQQDSTNQSAYAAVRQWALGIVGKSAAQPWLYLSGGKGCGKTHLAAAAANALTQQGISLILLTSPEFLGMLKRDQFRELEPLIAAVQRIPVLILDDLGVEKGSDWVREQIFRVVDGRSVNQNATLWISNHPLRGVYPAIPLGDRLGARITSRLGDVALCTVVANGGRDRRRR